MMPVRLAAGMIGVLFLCISGVINWSYGASLGREGADQIVFGSVSVLGDLVKALSPFLLMMWIERKRWLAASVSAALFVVATLYSLSALCGFLELNQSTREVRISQGHFSQDGLKKELARFEAEIDKLGKVTSEAVARSRLETLMFDRRWRSSGECAAVRSRGDERLCTEVGRAREELARAREGERLRAAVRDTRALLESGMRGGALVEADPRAGFLNRVWGIRADHGETALSFVFVALVELGSGLGLFVAFGHGRFRETGRPQPEPLPDQPVSGEETRVKGDVLKFARARTRPGAGKSVTSRVLFEVYTRWCAETGVESEEYDVFNDVFSKLSKAIGLKIRNGKDGLRFEGIILV